MIIFTVYMATVNILFVCYGNTCRSPMASALLKKKIKGRGLFGKIKCDSCGISANVGEEMTQNAELALKELGVGVFKHTSKKFELNALKKNKLILTMTNAIKDTICSSCFGAFNVHSLSDYVSGEEIPDPYGKSLQEYLSVARYLDYLMDRVLDKVIKEYHIE